MSERPPIVGVSDEVAAHHIRQHRCEPDVDADTEAYEVVCPCGTCSAIMCARCDEPLFLQVDTDAWCVHADELARECGRLP